MRLGKTMKKISLLKLLAFIWVVFSFADAFPGPRERLVSAVSANGEYNVESRQFFGGEEADVTVRDSSGETVGEFTINTSPHGVFKTLVSDDGKRVVVFCHGWYGAVWIQSIRFYDTNGNLVKNHDVGARRMRPPVSPQISPDGRNLIYGGLYYPAADPRHMGISAHRMTTGEQIWETGLESRPRDIKTSGDSRWIVALTGTDPASREIVLMNSAGRKYDSKILGITPGPHGEELIFESISRGGDEIIFREQSVEKKDDRFRRKETRRFILKRVRGNLVLEEVIELEETE